MKYFYSKRVAKSRTLCLLSPRGTQPGTAPGARTSCPLWMPLNHSRAPMNIGRPKRTGCPRAVPLAVTAGAVPGCPPARALERRAVRLACPDRRIASRRKGRRDALPYVSPSSSTRQGCQQVAAGRPERQGADHRIDARVATHLGEVPETALPVWKLVSLPALMVVVWHPSGMQTDCPPRTGGRSPCHPGTTHRLGRPGLVT